MDSARTMVSGFGRSASSKASYLARKQERFDAANAELQQMQEAGIIKSNGKLIESPPAPNELIANRDHSCSFTLEWRTNRLLLGTRFCCRPFKRGHF